MARRKNVEASHIGAGSKEALEYVLVALESNLCIS